MVGDTEAEKYDSLTLLKFLNKHIWLNECATCSYTRAPITLSNRLLEEGFQAPRTLMSLLTDDL